MENELSCHVDWLSWTVLDIKSLTSVLLEFGFVLSDFYRCEKGASGYRRMLLYHKSNIRVLYDGSADMGIHFDVSGSAVHDLLEVYREVIAEETPFGGTAIDIDITVLQALFTRIGELGRVTRLDLAVDDMLPQPFFTVSDFVDVLDARCFTSRFRSWRQIVEKTTAGEPIGHTVYMGSRSSSVMLRVYDKRLEYSARHGVVVTAPWVRWELELKEDRAQAAARHLAFGLSAGEVTLGILSQYLRIVVLDRTRIERCSDDPRWTAFLAGVRRLKLFTLHDESTLKDKEDWILRQVAPTLAAVIISKYGDVSFLTDHLGTYAGRMKKHLVELVDEAYPEWREVFRCQNED